MQKKTVLWVVLALVLLGLGYGAFRFYQVWYDRKVPNFTGDVQLFVYPHDDVSAVRDSLMAHARKPASIARVFKGVESLPAGHYRVDSTCTSMYAVRMLQHGWQAPVNLTLSGAIRTPGALCRKIGAQMLADSAAVGAFIADSLTSYGVDGRQLFTLVIPDTYQMLWTASVRDIFDRLATEHDKWWTPERRAAAQAQGLSMQEVSVLASIVDGETRYVPEQPTIAGVYLNRLHSGMKLQADPTIAYCYDYKLNRILKRHLEVDSPYNTYKHHGLPPGPISCPPKSCLEAVLHPAQHNYIFFCADPSFNGSHRFAASYTQHLVNARAFQKALTERQRAAK